MPDARLNKILIVEEESLLGWSMANALRRAGYEPDLVECGDEALKKMATGGYDLVVSDIRLQGIDGLELGRRLRKLPYSVPLIIITTLEDLPATEVGASGGVDQFIEKPFQLTELVKTVEELIGTSGFISENFHRS